MGLSVQTQALLLILLIAGQEAARVQEASRIYSKSSSLHRPDPMSVENAACEWWNSKMKCAPAVNSKLVNGGDESPCSWRFLPLDGLPPVSSQGCRLTDDYMLENDRAKFSRLQAELIAQKSEKFADNCNEASVFNLYCKRRATQMFRAMTFLSKAQDLPLADSLNDQQREEFQTQMQALMDQSWRGMAVLAGKEADHVARLKEKIMDDPEGFRQAPIESIQKVMGTLMDLLKGTTEEKDEARGKIESWEAPRSDSPPVDERALAEKLEQSKTTIRQDVDELSEDVSKEEQFTGKSQNLTKVEGSALIENHSASPWVMRVFRIIGVVVFIAAFVSAIIFALTPLLIGLFATLFLSILGCGIYDKIYPEKKKDEDATSTNKTEVGRATRVPTDVGPITRVSPVRSLVQIGSHVQHPIHGGESLCEVNGQCGRCVASIVGAPFTLMGYMVSKLGF